MELHLLGMAVSLEDARVVVAGDGDLQSVTLFSGRNSVHVAIVVGVVGLPIRDDIVLELLHLPIDLFPIHLHVQGVVVGALQNCVRGLDGGGPLVVFAGGGE